jgi:hypothetical protein
MRDPKPTGQHRRPPETVAAELDAEERIALFCIASHTSFGMSGGNITRTRLIVRGLIDRDGSRVFITDQGRAVLAALIGGGR